MVVSLYIKQDGKNTALFFVLNYFPKKLKSFFDAFNAILGAIVFDVVIRFIPQKTKVLKKKLQMFCKILLDKSASDKNVALINDRGLTRRGRSLGFVKDYFRKALSDIGDGCRCRLVRVSYLDVIFFTERYSA